MPPLNHMSWSRFLRGLTAFPLRGRFSRFLYDAHAFAARRSLSDAAGKPLVGNSGNKADFEPHVENPFSEKKRRGEKRSANPQGMPRFLALLCLKADTNPQESEQTQNGKRTQTIARTTYFPLQPVMDSLDADPEILRKMQKAEYHLFSGGGHDKFEEAVTSLLAKEKGKVYQWKAYSFKERMRGITRDAIDVVERVTNGRQKEVLLKHKISLELKEGQLFLIPNGWGLKQKDGSIKIRGGAHGRENVPVGTPLDMKAIQEIVTIINLPESVQREFRKFVKSLEGEKDFYKYPNLYKQKAAEKMKELLPQGALDAFTEAGKTGGPPLLMNNYPIDEVIPPGSTIEERVAKKGRVSEMALAAIPSLLGKAPSKKHYKLQQVFKEQGGRPIHQVSPKTNPGGQKASRWFQRVFIRDHSTFSKKGENHGFFMSPITILERSFLTQEKKPHAIEVPREPNARYSRKTKQSSERPPTSLGR